MSRINKLRNQGKVNTQVMNNIETVNYILLQNKINQRNSEARAIKSAKTIFIN